MISNAKPEAEPPPKERTARRSRSGCWTCRSKTVKKRCDQQRPCGRCSRLNLYCDYSVRPTLAERREAVRKTSSTQAGDGIERGPASSPTSSNCSTSPPLSIINISAPASTVSSLELSSADHEAIRHFRTEFPKSHHVKNTDYSLISLMFNLAHDEPMIMHMVLAVGLQEMSSRRPILLSSELQSSLQHYSSAIRLMARAVSPMASLDKVDATYTALWMMLLYEQQFGDSLCTAYVHHLEAVSSLLYHQFQPLLIRPSTNSEVTETSLALREKSGSRENTTLSLYSARVLIWIAQLDAAAASSGIGGQVNSAILSTLSQSSVVSSTPFMDPITAFSSLHQYSGPLYRLAWGDEYPHNEMLDDVENRDAYSLLAGCVQLRFMTAQLATLYRTDLVTASQLAVKVEDSIKRVGETFDELIVMASKLSLETDNSHRVIANVRVIVPIYFAIVLDFLRLTRFDLPLGGQQRHALRVIMNLAFQNHRHGGDEALIKLAWPLFIAALETDDLLHREWILGRFETGSKYGKNFERAYNFLRKIIPTQQRLGKRVDVREEMSKAALFVLG